MVPDGIKWSSNNKKERNTFVHMIHRDNNERYGVGRWLYVTRGQKEKGIKKAHER